MPQYIIVKTNNIFQFWTVFDTFFSHSTYTWVDLYVGRLIREYIRYVLKCGWKTGAFKTTTTVEEEEATLNKL